MTLNYPKRGLINFSRFWAATHISKVNCAEMALDKPGQPMVILSWCLGVCLSRSGTVLRPREIETSSYHRMIAQSFGIS